jgi:hypothetical protein
MQTGVPSGQKLILGLIAAITLEVVSFRMYAPFPAFSHFLNASEKSCSVRVNTPLDARENYGNALDLALHLSRLFGVCASYIRLTLSSLNTCLIIARVSVALFPGFAQRFNAVPLSDLL